MPFRHSQSRPLMKGNRSLIDESSPSIGNYLGRSLFSPNVASMAVRARTSKGLSVSRNERLRTLVLVIVITCVPVLATLLAIVSTTEPDLSDLAPIGQTPGQYVLLNWFALRNGHLSAESAIQALGYMVESDRSPTQATGFGILFCCQKPEISCTRRTGYRTR